MNDGRRRFTVRMDITNKCNLRCAMCHVGDPSRNPAAVPRMEMSVPQIEKIFKDSDPIVKEVILSCAFEPTACRNFADIITCFADKKPGIEIGLCTNGMLLDASLAQHLIKCGVSNLMVSLDGTRRDTVEAIRAGAKYDIIIRNLLNLRELKKLSRCAHPYLTLNYVMMNSNVHEAPDFVEMASALEASAIDFRHVILPQWMDQAESLSAHKAKFNYFRNRILQKAEKWNSRNLFIPAAFPVEEEWNPEEEPASMLENFYSLAPDISSAEPIVTGKIPGAYTFQDGTAGLEPGFYCHVPFSEIFLAEQEYYKPCWAFKGDLGRVSRGDSIASVANGSSLISLLENVRQGKKDSRCEGCAIMAGYFGSRSEKR